jgi:hypothetical protein
VEVDGHSFYTHFQILNKDDPRNVIIRGSSVICLPEKPPLETRIRRCLSVPRHRRRPMAPPDATALSGGERDLLEEWLAASRSW